jgi:hypothetical protein
MICGVALHEKRLGRVASGEDGVHHGVRLRRDAETAAPSPGAMVDSAFGGWRIPFELRCSSRR